MAHFQSKGEVENYSCCCQLATDNTHDMAPIFTKFGYMNHPIWIMKCVVWYEISSLLIVVKGDRTWGTNSSNTLVLSMLVCS